MCVECFPDVVCVLNTSSDFHLQKNSREGGNGLMMEERAEKWLECISIETMGVHTRGYHHPILNY